MSELEQSLKLYTETLALSNLNLDDVPSNVRPGRESQKRQAASDLEHVRNQYASDLRKALFGLLVTGPGTDAFLKIAEEEAEVVVVDGAAIYKRIADRVAPAMSSNREFGVSHYSAVIQELRTIGGELNVTSMPAPVWSEPANVADAEGLLKHVRGMVNSGVGLDLPALYISRQIIDAAIAAGSNRPTVVVVVTGLEDVAEAMAPKLFHEGRSIQVTTTSEVNKEFVLDTFNKVKKQIKASKKT